MSCNFSDKPIRMLDGQRCSNDCAFRFKPQQELHSLGVGSIADWSKTSIWMRHLINPPISGVQEPIFFSEYLKFIDWTVRSIPTGVHPEVLKSNAFFRDLIDQPQAGRGFHSAPAGERNRQHDWLSIILRRVIFQDVTTQNIVRVDIVPLPRQQKYFRRSNLLAGMQRQMRRFHSGSDRDRSLGRSRKVDGPFARPSHRADQPTTVRENIEERYRLTRLATAFTGNLKRLELIQRLLCQRIGIHTAASLGIKNCRNATPSTANDISSASTYSSIGVSSLPSFLKYAVH